MCEGSVHFFLISFLLSFFVVVLIIFCCHCFFVSHHAFSYITLLLLWKAVLRGCIIYESVHAPKCLYFAFILVAEFILARILLCLAYLIPANVFIATHVT